MDDVPYYDEDVRWLGWRTLQCLGVRPKNYHPHLAPPSDRKQRIDEWLREAFDKSTLEPERAIALAGLDELQEMENG